MEENFTKPVNASSDISKERPIAELLKVLKKYYQENAERMSGLCYTVYSAADKDLFTEDEYITLSIFINEHKPAWYSGHYPIINPDRKYGYYWKKYEKKARIRWIDAMIKRYQ